MKTARIALLIFIILVLVAGIPYLGHLLYRQYKSASSSPMAAVPDRTALIIKVNKPLNLYQDVSQSNLIWKEIRNFPGIDKIGAELVMADSLARINKDFRKLINDNPLLICLSQTNDSKFGILFLGSYPGGVSDEEIETFFTTNYPGKAVILTTTYASNRLYKIHTKTGGKSIYAAAARGVFLMSHYPDLVKKGIDRMSLNTPAVLGNSFTSVERVMGKKVDVNIFLNIPFFSLASWDVLSEEQKNSVAKLAKFAEWSGLDLVIKDDELLINGFTTFSDSVFHTLALFSGQEPQVMDAFSIMPGNVHTLTEFAFTDYGTYLKKIRDRERRIEYTGEPGRLTLFNRQHRIQTENYFLPWSGSQFCRCIADEPADQNTEYTITLIQTTSADTARKMLFQLSGLLKQKTDSIKYKNYTIYTANIGNALNAYLGTLFPPVPAGYFMPVDRFIAFASDPIFLRYLADQVQSGTTLSNQISFKNVLENMSERSNIFYYCKPRLLFSQHPPVFSAGLHQYAKPLLDSLGKFESFTFQLSSGDNLSYTNLALRFNPNPTDEGPLLFQARLDTLAAGSPRIVNREDPDEKGVLVQDTTQTLYLIDKTGQIVWKRKLYGHILGQIHEIRLPGNDTLCYLFNTENHLYVIRNGTGEPAPRFPMKFPMKATNGLTLTDYNGDRDYRILIAFRDNQVYNFNISGVTVEGWNRVRMKSEIREPVVYRQINRQDYLVIEDISGNIQITDRRGIPRIRTEKSFAIAPHSSLFLNRSNRKGVFVTTNDKGKLLFMQENGRMTSATPNLFSSNHTFKYEDITGDYRYEYIFYDKNTLYYYDHSLKLVYSHHFRYDVSPPHIIRRINGSLYLGLYSPSGKAVFLFGKNGLIRTDKAIRGTTPFDIGDLEGDTKLNLVIGSGKMLKAYRLTQF